jgi:hypothetical protein
MQEKTVVEFMILKNYPTTRQFIIKKEIGKSIFELLFRLIKRK